MDRLSQIGNQLAAGVTGGGRDKILQKNADDVSTITTTTQAERYTYKTKRQECD